MIINGRTLLEMAPITDMASDKYRDHGVSYGLGEAGYDIRLKQEIIFEPNHKYPNFSYPDMVKINGKTVSHLEKEHLMNKLEKSLDEKKSVKKTKILL